MNALGKRNLCFVFIMFFVIPICVASEFFATTEYISLLAMMLLVIIVSAVLLTNDDGLVTPLTFFSLMYSGYAVGALYYAQSGGYFGKFIEFYSLRREQVELYMVQALFFAIACYLLFWLGYVLNKKKERSCLEYKSSGVIDFVSKNRGLLLFPLILITFLYWVWVCNTIAGSIGNALIQFQLFPHLVQEHNISIAPYLIYYAAVNIWFICIISSGEQVSKKFLFCAAVGFVMSISTARITISISYLLSLLTFAYIARDEYRNRLFLIGATLLVSSFIIYVLREFSNYYFLYGDVEKVEFNFLAGLIGGGNVTDLQQLVIIFNSFNVNNSLIGSSYLDWFNNSLGVYFGMKPNSIGLLIHELYMPDSSGAPTPGAIGELYANFNLLSPLVMFFIGYFMAAIRNVSISTNNYLVLFCYSTFLVCFVFMYPKVDSTMLVNFMWGVMPTLSLVFLFYLLHRVVVGIKVKEIHNID